MGAGGVRGKRERGISPLSSVTSEELELVVRNSEAGGCFKIRHCAKRIIYTYPTAKQTLSAILSALNYLFRPVLSKPHYYFIVSLFYVLY